MEIAVLVILAIAFAVMLGVHLKGRGAVVAKDAEIQRLKIELENAARVAAEKDAGSAERLHDKEVRCSLLLQNKDDASATLLAEKDKACAAALAAKDRSVAEILAEKDAALQRKDADCRKVIDEKNAEIERFLQEKEKSFAETVKTEVAGKLATDLNSNKFVFGAAGPKYDFDDEISGTGYNS